MIFELQLAAVEKPGGTLICLVAKKVKRDFITIINIAITRIRFLIVYINVTPSHPLGHRQLLLRNKWLVRVILKSARSFNSFYIPTVSGLI